LSSKTNVSLKLSRNSWFDGSGRTHDVFVIHPKVFPVSVCLQSKLWWKLFDGWRGGPSYKTLTYRLRYKRNCDAVA